MAVSRFRGLPEEALEFFRALEREPCPDTMPGGDRAAYAAHVLTPLKALARRVGDILSDVSPPLGMEARAGASLDWPDGERRDPDECPIRRLRLWDASRDAQSSPLLYATFFADGIEVGVTGPFGQDDAAARSAALDVAGWEVDGEDAFRVRRVLRWEPWIGNPEFAEELARLFRELLPLFDVLRGAPGAAQPIGRASGDR